MLTLCEICKRCVAARSEIEWNEMDDLRWEGGTVVCPVGTREIRTIGMNDYPPSFCFYRAEILMTLEMVDVHSVRVREITRDDLM